jgi:predicted DNA-binding transcriptional regulator AlpA
MNEHQKEAVTDREAAKLLGLSVATLRAWRLRRRGPRYLRFGRAVRYLPADIDRFIEASSIDPRPVPTSRRQPL